MKYKQLTEEDELVGKTIEKVCWYDNKYYLFLNDKFLIIFRGCGYEDSDVQIDDNTDQLLPNKYNLYKLKNLGFISEQEYEKLKLDFQKEDEKYIRNKEKKEYERLKAKYSK